MPIENLLFLSLLYGGRGVNNIRRQRVRIISPMFRFTPYVTLAIICLVASIARGQAAPVRPLQADAKPPAAADPLDELIRKLILDVMPREYVDDDEWGGTKLFTTDLHVHREGPKIETRRKREPLNHGNWELYRVTLADAERFELDLHDVGRGDAGATSFIIDIALPLRVHGRQAMWRRGVQLWSVSADAHATVRLRLHCQAALKVDTTQFPPAVAIRPTVDAADIRLEQFRLIGVSKIRGDAAKEFGNAIRGRLARRLAAQDEKLVQKINGRIAKSEDRLQLSLSALAKSPFRKLSNDAAE